MKLRSLFLGVMFLALPGFSVLAQTTAFTYQGNLTANGAAANGSYSLRFILRPQNGSPSQVGITLTNQPVGVTNGLFTVTLDFGNVFAASPLYLEIGVRTNGNTGAFSILSPDQLLTSAPYAVQALNSSSFTGGIADAQLSTNIPQLNASQTFTGAVKFNNATGAFSGTLVGAATGTFSGTASGNFNGIATGTFIGDGGLITNLNVTNIIGVVQSNPNWQLMQSTSQVAVVANNYLTTNALLTTLTLPATPNVGSTVWIAGSGAQGWAIGQSAGQSIVTATLGLPAGQIWQAQQTSQNWRAVASSANGLRLVAAYGGGLGFIYYSSNGGQTWSNSTAPQLNWSGLASSADGLHVVAVPNGGFPYTSADGGATWTVQSTSGNANTAYRCVASSADGVDLVAGVGGAGAIYTSVNSGVNWTAQAGAGVRNWLGVASSTDGSHLAAVNNGGLIYVSKDFGVTWTGYGPAGTFWTAIASSASGSSLVAASSSVSIGYVYTSGDGGVTWTPRFGSAPWTCVTSSTNGLNLAAAYGSGFIYTSQDGGQTWAQRTNGISSSAQSFSAITTSGDGSRLLAGVGTGSLYTSIAGTTPGPTGSLAGSQYSNLQLQYIGNGQWMPLNSTGTFTGK